VSLADNLKNVASNMQQSTKNASITFSQRVLRLISGFFVGIVLSLIIQEFTQSGTLMLFFFTTLFMLIIYKLLRQLSLFQIFIFDVICILIATSLRLYIMIAP
jgi:F0F1-type ATP synthase assembly protein I